MIPHPVSDKAIARAEKHRQRAQRNIAANLGRDWGYWSPFATWQRKQAHAAKHRREQQEAFLSVYSVTLSPSLAAARAGCTVKQYRRWRRTDPDFMRAYNQTLATALDELQGAVVVRAMGRHAVSGDGQPLYDGSGRPVRIGGSDRLAVALLGLGEKSVSQAEDAEINIVSKTLPVQ